MQIPDYMNYAMNISKYCGKSSHVFLFIAWTGISPDESLWATEILKQTEPRDILRVVI